MSIYSDIEPFVFDMIKTYGREIEIHHLVDKGVDNTTGEETSNKIISRVYGIQNDYSELFQTDGSPIQKGDRNFTITSRKGKPRIGDQLLAGGVLHSIVNVEEIAPAGDYLMFEVRARSYQLTEFADTLTVSLGTLNSGAIVADTSIDNLQRWRVIAHNHFLSGYTTLMLDSLFDLELQPFTGSGGYPTKPWISTWMRKYLLSTFKNKMSPSLIALLKEVNITTDGKLSSDTIYLLSKVELGGSDIGTDVEIGLTPFGTKISYFDLDTKRIATYDGTNTTYWTRGAEGVGSDGKFKILNPAYAYGVRPVINIRSSIQTALNLAGEYELQF